MEFTGTLPGEEDEGPCEVCGNYVDDCTCVECLICGSFGRLACYTVDKHLQFTEEQEQAIKQRQKDLEEFYTNEAKALAEEYKYMKILESRETV